MTAGYATRLVLQCLSSFFVVHLLLCIAVRLLTPAALWCASRMHAGLGARLLFALRILPAMASCCATLLLIFPSYLKFERNASSEIVGGWALLFGALALAVWIRPLWRAATAIFRSSRFVSQAKRTAEPANLASMPVWLSCEEPPRMAVAGLLRPQVFMSSSLPSILSPAEMEAALRHEHAHKLFARQPEATVFVAFAGRIPVG